MEKQFLKVWANLSSERDNAICFVSIQTHRVTILLNPINSGRWTDGWWKGWNKEVNGEVDSISGLNRVYLIDLIEVFEKGSIKRGKCIIGKYLFATR